MFKNAAQLPSYKKYLTVLRTVLKRLKKLQKAQNAADGRQANDVIQSIRYFPQYVFDDKKDKKPHALILVGKKTVVSRVSEELIKATSKEVKTKPTASGKGFAHWHETDQTFYFQTKGPVKLTELKKLIKKAGFKDKVLLGEATDEDEKKANAAEARLDQLESSVPVDLEEDEELPDFDDDEDEAEESSEEGEGKTGSTGNLADEYEQRLGEIKPRATIAGKLQGEEALQAKLWVSEAQVFGRKEEFQRALDLLNQAEPLIDSLLGAKADYDAEFAEVEPAFLQAVREFPDKASSLRAVMGFATGKAETGEYNKAIEGLRRLESMISGASSEGPSSPQPGVNVKAAAAKFDAAKLRAQWEAAAEAAMDGVAKIEASLRRFSNPEVLEAAEIVGELVNAFPNDMEGALDSLDQAAKDGDHDGIATARASVRASAQTCLGFLNDNADLIKTCETNPYGITIAVSAELKQALKEILQGVG